MESAWILGLISSLDVVPGSPVAAHCSPEEEGSDAKSSYTVLHCVHVTNKVSSPHLLLVYWKIR